MRRVQTKFLCQHQRPVQFYPQTGIDFEGLRHGRLIDEVDHATSSRVPAIINLNNYNNIILTNTEKNQIECKQLKPTKNISE